MSERHDDRDRPASRGPDKTLPCPICRKPVDMDSLGKPGSSFPFCSPRCRDVDLGRWLDGKYQIPVDEDPNDADERPPPGPRRR